MLVGFYFSLQLRQRLCLIIYNTLRDRPTPVSNGLLDYAAEQVTKGCFIIATTSQSWRLKRNVVRLGVRGSFAYNFKPG